MALTDYVIMPSADYVAACDKVRERTGKTAPIKSGDLAAEIEGIPAGGGGGGSIEGFHKVRFFNDDRTTLLYTVFVPHGASAMYAGETPVSTEIVGGTFTGFEPVAVNVTEDMDCFAVYEEGITTLDAATWEKISELSANGEAQNYFAVGDTKMIHIEGTVGTIGVNGDFGVYIIGFNHNAEVEGNGITFGTFKTAASGGKDICLVDSKYGSGSEDGTKYFNMNHWSNVNYGGWAGCDMRYDILGSTDVAPSGYGTAKSTSTVGYDATANCATTPVANTLMAALPSDLRAVMKPMSVYSNNVGDSGGTGTKVTVSVDYLPFAAECEIIGVAGLALKYEANHQAQYDYYKAGNSRVKYSHSSIGSAVRWWWRSTSGNISTSYCMCPESGDNNHIYTRVSCGLAPIFKV